MSKHEFALNSNERTNSILVLSKRFPVQSAPEASHSVHWFPTQKQNKAKLTRLLKRMSCSRSNWRVSWPVLQMHTTPCSCRITLTCSTRSCVSLALYVKPNLFKRLWCSNSTQIEGTRMLPGLHDLMRLHKSLCVQRYPAIPYKSARDTMIGGNLYCKFTKVRKK